MSNNNIKIKRNLLNLENIYTFAAVIYCISVIFYIGTFFTDRPRYGILFFGESMIIFILQVLKKRYKIIKKVSNSFIVKLIVIISVLLVIFIVYHYWKDFNLLIYERAGNSTLLDKILGGIAVIMVFIAVYIVSGPPIVFVTLFFIFYAFFGNYFPGILKFDGLTISRLVDISSVQISRGIFGKLLQLGGTLLAIYVMFAGFVECLGGFKIITRISLLIAKFSKYYVTQSAVFASAVMGMFSGSGQANVAATGSFTIPLMVKYKLPSHVAGAIEAVASAGGQIMPPVMGTAAFLMADFLGIPYIKIAKIAALPAILFFSSVAFSVNHISHLYKIEIPIDIEAENKSEVLGVKEEILHFFITGFPLLFSLILLLYLMVIRQMHVLLVGYYVVIFSIIFSFIFNFFLEGIYKKLKYIPNYINYFIGSLIKGVKKSAIPIMEISLTICLISIVIAIVSTSGLSSKLNFLLLSLAKGQIIILLILSAVVSIMLGFVVSTAAVYILAMVTVVPPLLRAGIDPIVAHFYVFWFAILSLIIPPVANGVIAACRIAQSDFLKTAREALKIGIPLFIIPISMVTHPQILIWDNRTIFTFLSQIVAIYAISTAFYGKYIFMEIKGIYAKLIRVILGILGFSCFVIFFKQEYILYIISLVTIIFLIFLKLKVKKPNLYVK